MLEKIPLISSARGLAKNPLGIIALFIVLIYAFAALTLSMTSSLNSSERLPLVWFLVTFPVIVLFVFAWLVSKHHEKLYAPSDFKSDDSFYESTRKKLESAQRLESERENIFYTIKKNIIENSNNEKTNSKENIETIVKSAIKEFESSSNVKVDARKFLKDDRAIFDFPVAIFETVGDLTDAVYFKLAPFVQPFEYGHSWLLRNKKNGKFIRTARMIFGAPAGKPVPDNRPIEEIDVFPGSELEVEFTSN